MTQRTLPDDNLSSTRGNALGITLLKWMMCFPGLRFSCAFIWCISFFYVLFDRTGCRKASFYLSHRFPHDNRSQRFYHTWALFTSQGQSLLQAWALRNGQAEFECLHFERYTQQIHGSKGAVFLCSHFGSWQGMIRMIGRFDRKIYILARPDQNKNVDKSMAVDGQEKIGWISTDSPMGGLLDVYDALVNGNLVCIMGDRSLENDAVRIPFLGEEASFPMAAFQIAAQARVKVFPVFAFRKDSFRKVTLDIFDPIEIPEGTVGKRSRLKHSLTEYVRLLENMAQKYPYECYIFENIWRKNETT